MITHNAYPSDVSDAEWQFVVPYLCLLPEDAGQRVHDLREIFDAARWLAALAEAVQEATEDSVELAYVDQGYTGADTEATAADEGIDLEVVKLPEAKRGFVLLPRWWVVERSFGLRKTTSG